MEIKRIVDELIKEAKESTSEGGWIYETCEIEDWFKIKLNEDMINEIVNLLQVHKDVADVQMYDDCIDIMLYQDSF